MRFASYLKDGRPSFGLVTEGGIVDLAHPEPSLKAAIAAGTLEALGREAANARPTLQEDQITFLPVITDPAKVFCVGLNYEDHRQETGRSVVGHPTIFTRFANCLAGHEGEIVRPRESDNLDYEGELAVIIGRGGRRIAEADAWDHIAGYACFNDASVRDWQNHTHQYTPGKNFMTTGPFGPYLVTPDEVGEIGPQTIQTRLNGEVVQSSSLDHMIFSIPGDHRLPLHLHRAGARRRHRHGHPRRRRRQAHPAAVDEAGGRGGGGDREGGPAAVAGRGGALNSGPPRLSRLFPPQSAHHEIPRPVQDLHPFR